MNAPTNDLLAQEFVQFSVEAGVLRFGDFKTKAGRQSPYFFNTGLFDDGAKLMRLGEFYARRLVDSGLAFDMLFGPAYKGIALAADYLPPGKILKLRAPCGHLNPVRWV